MPRKAKTEKKEKVVKVKVNPEEGLAVAEAPSKRGRKKKTVIDLQQADGKLYNKHNVRSLDELLGIQTTKYSTHDYAAYENQIQAMNTSDLQKHCTQVDVMPNQDRGVMIKRLLKQFRVTNSSYLNTAQTVDPIHKPISQATLDILSEGR